MGLKGEAIAYPDENRPNYFLRIDGLDVVRYTPSKTTTKPRKLKKLNVSDKINQAKAALKMGSRRKITDKNPADNFLRLYDHRE
jgi:hypothetical protein